LKVISSTVIGVALFGCVATGPLYSTPEPPVSTAAKVVVYRISQFGGKGGSWVPTKLEVNVMPTRMLPADSFVVLEVPAGDVTLSATDLVNLHYDDKNRMTLSERVSEGEIAYFRILSVYGEGCAAIYEKVEGGVIAYATHYLIPGIEQTTCFQRVPEAIALKHLKHLRRAD
jgi:hypothetical protein